MKKDRHSRILNGNYYDKFSYSDTRYYGLFLKGNKNEVFIDTKRYQKFFKCDNNMLSIINKRKTHLFKPQKTDYFDYHCNEFINTIDNIEKDWNNDFKPMITYCINKIEKPKELFPGDYPNLQIGISGVNAASQWALYMNSRNNSEYNRECQNTYISLYAQFIHQMASKIEATTIKVLTKENAIKDKFDRNILYATAVGKSKKIDELTHFNYYDKLYRLWHFIKHNSISTYDKLKEKYPEVLTDSNYIQGELAISYVKFSDDLIINLINGCKEFFKEYCNLVFSEDYNESQWNYDKYFTNQVYDEIDLNTNPLGLSIFDELD